MTLDNYRKERKEWRVASFGFKGNQEDKNFIKLFTKDNNLANEGEALHYIVETFKQTNAITLELSTKNAAQANEIQNLQEKLTNLQTEKDRLLSGYQNMVEQKKQAEEDAWPHFASQNGVIDKLREFKKQTSEAMRMLFLDNSLRELNEAELIELMLDYCQRDPSEQFPFEPVAKEIVERQKTAA